MKVLGIGQTKPGSATATRLGLQRKWGPPRAIYLANSRYFFALMSSTFSNNPELLCRWRFSFFSSTDQVVKTMSRLLFLTLIILCKTRTIKAKLFQEETFFNIIFTYEVCFIYTFSYSLLSAGSILESIHHLQTNI